MCFAFAPTLCFSTQIVFSNIISSPTQLRARSESSAAGYQSPRMLSRAASKIEESLEGIRDRSGAIVRPKIDTFSRAKSVPPSRLAGGSLLLGLPAVEVSQVDSPRQQTSVWYVCSCELTAAIVCFCDMSAGVHRFRFGI